MNRARSRFENGDSDSSTLRRPLFRTRKTRVGLEIGYDAIAWTTGISISALATRDVPAGGASPFLITRAVLVVWVLSAATGLLGGLYRGRYQRGSLDEVMSVGIAGGLMTVALTAVGSLPIIGQRAPLETVAGGALFALPTMAGARYVVCAARQLGRRPALVHRHDAAVLAGRRVPGAPLLLGFGVEPVGVARSGDDPGEHAERRVLVVGAGVAEDEQ